MSSSRTDPRGALDSHLQHPGEHHGALTAIYIDSVRSAIGEIPKG